VSVRDGDFESVASMFACVCTFVCGCVCF